MKHLILAAFLLLSFNAQAQVVRSGTAPQTISVTAEASAWLGPDSARASFVFEQTSDSLNSAMQSLEATTKRVRDAVSAVDKTSRFQLRGDNFSAENNNGTSTGLTKGHAVTIRRNLGLEVSDLGKLSAVLDAAFNAGAKTVGAIEYRRANVEAAKLQAVAVAAQRAQEKAKQLAKSLNVLLGEVIAVSQTEESVGTIFRERARQGVTPLAEGDVDMKIFVTVDFAILPPKLLANLPQ